ncbi:MAG: hypothetical protein PHE56_06500, partial [Bacteroidales bacterium]|nr:hypothetical protein [Bacteroidales bacterium]
MTHLVQVKIVNDLKNLAVYFNLEMKTGHKYPDKCDKIVFEAPRAGRAKRRAAQAVRAKQLELCRADMSFSKTNI